MLFCRDNVKFTAEQAGLADAIVLPGVGVPAQGIKAPTPITFNTPPVLATRIDVIVFE